MRLRRNPDAPRYTVAQLEEIIYAYEWAVRASLARMRADASARRPFEASEQMRRAREIGAEITDRRERRA